MGVVGIGDGGNIENSDGDGAINERYWSNTCPDHEALVRRDFSMKRSANSLSIVSTLLAKAMAATAKSTFVFGYQVSYGMILMNF